MRPETQREAYDSIKDHLPEKRRMVYDQIDSASTAGGITLFELCVKLKLPVNSVSGRVTELHDSAVIVDSGRRRINPDTGRRAVVWITRSRYDQEHSNFVPVFHRDGQGELF